MGHAHTKRQRAKAGLPKYARRKVTEDQVSALNREERSRFGEWAWGRDWRGRLHRAPMIYLGWD